MKKTILALAALAFMAWGCSSSDDDQPNPPVSQSIQEGNDTRPDWLSHAPNYDLFEQTMTTVDVWLQDTLQAYASANDLLCAKVGDEIRGVAQPEQINGLWKFTITVGSNDTEEKIMLYYYCDKLHRIFSIFWMTFDASIKPTGTDGIYQPEFVKNITATAPSRRQR